MNISEITRKIRLLDSEINSLDLDSPEGQRRLRKIKDEAVQLWSKAKKAKNVQTFLRDTRLHIEGHLHEPPSIFDLNA